MTAMCMLMAAGARSIKNPLYLGQASAEGTGTLLTINKPTGVQSGDLMTAIIAITNANRVFTPPAGWAFQGYAQNNIGGNQCIAVFTKTAGGSEGSSYAWSLDASATVSGLIIAHRFAMFGWVSDSYSAFASPCVPPGVNVPASGGEVIAAFMNTGASVSFGAPSGFTSLYADASATAPSLAVFKNSLTAATAAATASSSNTGGSSSNNFGLQFCILPNGTARDVPALIASSTNAITSAGTSITCSKPAGAQTGDLLVCLLAQAANNTVTDSHGFTEALDNNGLRVAWKILDGSEPSTLTFTLSGSTTAVVDLLLFRNATFDQIGTQYSSSASNDVAGTAFPTPSKDYALMLAHFVALSDTSATSLSYPDKAFSDLVSPNADANAPNRWIGVKRHGKESGGTSQKFSTNAAASGNRRMVAFSIVNSAY